MFVSKLTHSVGVRLLCGLRVWLDCATLSFSASKFPIFGALVKKNKKNFSFPLLTLENLYFNPVSAAVFIPAYP